MTARQGQTRQSRIECQALWVQVLKQIVRRRLRRIHFAAATNLPQPTERLACVTVLGGRLEEQDQAAPKSQDNSSETTFCLSVNLKS